MTGGQGNEGLIVPLALLADKAIDVVSFTHRDFGGHLVWGGHLCDHLNQYFANAGQPHPRARGQHPSRRPGQPLPAHDQPPWGHVRPGPGATDSQRRLGRPAVGFAFFGDGSSSTGDVHEAINLASLMSFPIVFVIENNGYAYSTPTDEQSRTAPSSGRGRRVTAWRGSSSSVGTRMTSAHSGGAIDKVRSTSRPMLIETQTLRLRGHAAYDTCDYLRPGESDSFFAAATRSPSSARGYRPESARRGSSPSTASSASLSRTALPSRLA